MTSKDNDEEHVMHSKNNNIKIMINDKEDEVTEELFQSLMSRYQFGLETSMNDSDFMFDCVHLLYSKCHKINFKCRSYIDPPDWIKNKKPTIHTVHKKDYKSFQFVVKAILNHEEIKKDPQGIAKIKHFLEKYYWEGKK